jgi:purine-nucleoside phosphorylase
MTKAAKTIRKIAGTTPISAALVLGSGLGAIGELLGDKVAIPYEELKGFPGGKVSGHGRDLLIGTLGGKRVAVLTGREHYYENGNADAMRVALETVADLGAKTADQFGRLARPGDAAGRSDADRRSHQLCRDESADRGTERPALR